MIKNEWLIVTVVGTLVRMILFMSGALPKEIQKMDLFQQQTAI